MDKQIRALAVAVQRDTLQLVSITEKVRRKADELARLVKRMEAREQALLASAGELSRLALSDLVEPKQGQPRPSAAANHYAGPSASHGEPYKSDRLID